jgi:hypothetical protein
LTLGIISLVSAFTCVLAPVGLPLGIAASLMGQGDVQKMRTRLMDPEGMPNTQGGLVCGLLGTVLNVLLLLWCGFTLLMG